MLKGGTWCWMSRLVASSSVSGLLWLALRFSLCFSLVDDDDDDDEEEEEEEEEGPLMTRGGRRGVTRSLG